MRPVRHAGAAAPRALVTARPRRTRLPATQPASSCIAAPAAQHSRGAFPSQVHGHTSPPWQRACMGMADGLGEHAMHEVGGTASTACLPAAVSRVSVACVDSM